MSDHPAAKGTNLPFIEYITKGREFFIEDKKFKFLDSCVGGG